MHGKVGCECAAELLAKDAPRGTPVVKLHLKRAANASNLIVPNPKERRHTYRSLLDAAGAPIGVQQKLMRHAQVSTTMNRYGTALMNEKRKANASVVRMVMRNQAVCSDHDEAVGFCEGDAPSANDDESCKS